MPLVREGEDDAPTSPYFVLTAKERYEACLQSGIALKPPDFSEQEVREILRSSCRKEAGLPWYFETRFESQLSGTERFLNRYDFEIGTSALLLVGAYCAWRWRRPIGTAAARALYALTNIDLRAIPRRWREY